MNYVHRNASIANHVLKMVPPMVSLGESDILDRRPTLRRPPDSISTLLKVQPQFRFRGRAFKNRYTSLWKCISLFELLRIRYINFANRAFEVLGGMHLAVFHLCKPDIQLLFLQI